MRQFINHLAIVILLATLAISCAGSSEDVEYIDILSIDPESAKAGPIELTVAFEYHTFIARTVYLCIGDDEICTIRDKMYVYGSGVDKFEYSMVADVTFSVWVNISELHTVPVDSWDPIDSDMGHVYITEE